MAKSGCPQIKCYLVEDKSSHEGSGGGFTVVRFFHLCVENHTDATLRRVTALYRLMKGNESFQDGDLCVEQVGPGQRVVSNTFIRDSAVFDRIEWVGEILVETDPRIPKEAITFDRRIPSASRTGCLLLAILGIVAVVVTYWLFFRE